MRNFALSILAAGMVLLATQVVAEKPSGSKYIDGGDSNIALILAHGRGKHPTWKVVNPLRKGVNEALGYHTLSLQMPNDNKKWKKYASDFPEAYAVIEDGIRFLKEEKGIQKIFLMGHSMGSRMVGAFMANKPSESIVGLIVVGCRNNGGSPLSCDENMEEVSIPVLDIWGGDDGKDSSAAGERGYLASEKYTQVAVPGAGHKLDGHNDEFVTAVVSWLEGQ